MERPRSSPSTRTALAILWFLGTLLSGAACSSGSSPAATFGGAPPMTLVTLPSGGINRWYRVYEPEGFDPLAPTPVVLAFHGGSGSASGFAAKSQLHLTADAHGFLLVYPEGTNNQPGTPAFQNQTWNSIECCGQADLNDIDDVGFVDDLLNDLEATYDVDTDRVYAIGSSNGGMMAVTLGVFLSNRIAAVASVSGCYPSETWPPAILPMAPVPFMEIHGVLDTILPYNGGVGSGEFAFDAPSTAESVQIWQTANMAQALVQTAQVGQAVREDGAAPMTGADVVLWTCMDGGHSWPGAPPALWPGQEVNQDIDAGEEAWAFFAAHPMSP